MASKAPRNKASAGSAEPTIETVEEKKRSSTRSNLIGGRGYRGGGPEKVSVELADVGPATDPESEPTQEASVAAVRVTPSVEGEAPVTMASLRPMRMDIQQLRQRADRSEAELQRVASGHEQLLKVQDTNQSEILGILEQLDRIDQLESRLADQQRQMERLDQLLQVQSSPEPEPEPESEPESTPAAWQQRCLELEQQLLELAANLEQKEQTLGDYAETVKSRDDELAELSLFADGLEAHNAELKALLEAQSHSRTQEQLLREEVARLQHQLADKSRELSELERSIREAPAPSLPPGVEELARRLALAHALLDEVDVLMDGIQPEPADLVLPLKRLRSRLHQLRGGASNFRSVNGSLSDSQERLLAPSQELTITRQRLLQTHNDLERTERERDQALGRLHQLLGGAS